MQKKDWWKVPNQPVRVPFLQAVYSFINALIKYTGPQSLSFLFSFANQQILCRHPDLRLLEFSTTNTQTVGIRKYPAIVLLEHFNFFCTRHFAPLQLRLFIPFAFLTRKICSVITLPNRFVKDQSYSSASFIFF